MVQLSCDAVTEVEKCNNKSGNRRRKTGSELFVDVAVNGSTQKDTGSDKGEKSSDMSGVVDLTDTGTSLRPPRSATSSENPAAAKKKLQGAAKVLAMKLEQAVTQLGKGDDMKDVRDKLNGELAESQHVASGTEGKAALVTREARRLNELEAEM